MSEGFPLTSPSLSLYLSVELLNSCKAHKAVSLCMLLEHLLCSKE